MEVWKIKTKTDSKETKDKIIDLFYKKHLRPSDIAEQLKKQHGVEVDKRKVTLDEPIRVLGSRFVEIKIHQKVTTKVRVDVKEKQ